MLFTGNDSDQIFSSMQQYMIDNGYWDENVWGTDSGQLFMRLMAEIVAANNYSVNRLYEESFEETARRIDTLVLALHRKGFVFEKFLNNNTKIYNIHRYYYYYHFSKTNTYSLYRYQFYAKGKLKIKFKNIVNEIDNFYKINNDLNFYLLDSNQTDYYVIPMTYSGFGYTVAETNSYQVCQVSAGANNCVSISNSKFIFAANELFNEILNSNNTEFILNTIYKIFNFKVNNISKNILKNKYEDITEINKAYMSLTNTGIPNLILENYLIGDEIEINYMKEKLGLSYIHNLDIPTSNLEILMELETNIIMYDEFGNITAEYTPQQWKDQTLAAIYHLQYKTVSSDGKIYSLFNHSFWTPTDDATINITLDFFLSKQQNTNIDINTVKSFLKEKLYSNNALVSVSDINRLLAQTVVSGYNAYKESGLKISVYPDNEALVDTVMTGSLIDYTYISPTVLSIAFKGTVYHDGNLDENDFIVNFGTLAKYFNETLTFAESLQQLKTNVEHLIDLAGKFYHSYYVNELSAINFNESAGINQDLFELYFPDHTDWNCVFTAASGNYQNAGYSIVWTIDKATGTLEFTLNWVNEASQFYVLLGRNNSSLQTKNNEVMLGRYVLAEFVS